MPPDGIRQFVQRLLPENLPGLGRIGSNGSGRQEHHPSRFHISPQFLALHCPFPLAWIVHYIVSAFLRENPRKPQGGLGNRPTRRAINCMPFLLSIYSSRKNRKRVFTFLSISCNIEPNRVGDLALSATGTGSCPEDEGCVPRWGHRTRCCIQDVLLYVATILGRANGRLFRCPSLLVIHIDSRRLFRRVFFMDLGRAAMPSLPTD